MAGRPNSPRRTTGGTKSTTAKSAASKKSTAKKPTAARPTAKKVSPPDPWFSRDQLRGVVPVVLVVGLAIAVLGGLAVLPARTWLSQRQNMADAQAELEQIEVDVAELEDDLELLGTEDEIERLARKNFDLVYPGEESYRIVPPEDG